MIVLNFNMQRIWYITITTVLMNVCLSLGKVMAQDKQKRKVSMKDSLDNAFDVSDYMIYSNGFILVPIPITEPALGGIGGALVPIFLKKRATVIDTVNGKVRITRVNPDMTAGLAMYTANNSWLTGVFRSGTLTKARITYRTAIAYANINMAFYRSLENAGQRKFDFNFKTVPVYLQALKQFSNARWSAGFQYMFLSTKVAAVRDSLPAFVTPKETKSNVSQLGGVLEYDGRDNIFTPDKGMRVRTDFYWSGDAIGSDYNFWRINYSFLGYTPITPRFIGGFRFEGQQVLEKPPFYLLPYINLRGVPAVEYQGNATLVSEAETRWDLYKRWSLVFYGGVGEAFNDWDNVFKDPLVYSYGTGFRYLIARKFKLRMGFDVARGPNQWAYYIVFGSNWFR
jgi:hypothetical protein